MPVVTIGLDELLPLLRQELDEETLENELHRFGASVEGWGTASRFKCPSCTAISESTDGEVPASCETCGLDFAAQGNAPAPAGETRVVKMELLADRPDLFDAAGLARALRGFLGVESGAPRYPVNDGSFTIEVDAALGDPVSYRPRICGAVVRGVALDDTRLRSLMQLQENLHWALGRDRKLVAIGVYDLARIAGPALTYRALAPDEATFAPLGCGGEEPWSLERVLAEHPKGKGFGRLLGSFSRYPVLSDAAGEVMALIPIINNDRSKVTGATTDVFIDATGLDDRPIDRAIAIMVSSLLEWSPGATAERVEVQYAEGARTTPQMDPAAVPLSTEAAARLVGCDWDSDALATRLRAMRHDVGDAKGDELVVSVPAWRADVMHPRDLMEDAAIAHGYDEIPARGLGSATYGRPARRSERAGFARESLAGQGFLEVMTLSLSSEESVFERAEVAREVEPAAIENPISVEQTIVRPSLVPGLLETLAINLGHPYPQRIFEVGDVVLLAPEDETGAREAGRAALALAGDGIGYHTVRAAIDAFLDDVGIPAEGRLFAPHEEGLFLTGRAAKVSVGGRALGRLGEVHPAVLERYRIVHPVSLAELDLEELFEAR